MGEMHVYYYSNGVLGYATRKSVFHITLICRVFAVEAGFYGF